MARRNQLPRHNDPTEIEPRPQPASDDGKHPNVAHLKQDITSGAAGDKVAMFDPGMANLGTGAEAAGTPMTPEMVRMDREAQRMADPPPGDPGKRMGLGKGVLVASGFALLVALGLAAALLG
jgi:hypothetical protein